MSTKGKAFKITSVLMAMVFMSMLFTGCVRTDKEGNLLYNGNTYSEVEIDGFYSPIVPEDNWKTIGLTPWFFYPVKMSPSENLAVCCGAALYWWVKDGYDFPSYQAINFDGVRIILSGHLIPSLSLYYDLELYDIVATESFETTIDKIVDSSIVAPCNINSDHRFCVQLHCDQGFYWIFHAYVVDGKYYLHSANEEFGYLVVDEFADWLRTLEPSQN